ncbi:MAG: UDP-N-acetylglucosamine pyrophosphorylase [Clostridia bacterium]|nr:UDP-N-acetylglucosamine pyrophosphorylase [Clostridia bacterium]
MTRNFDSISVERLFENIPEELAALFSGVTYPWEVLPNIRKYILEYLPKAGLTEILPDVYAAPDARIAKGAEIVGPTVIMSGAEIRHGAYIRGAAFIGRGAIVGNSTEVKNALLFDGANAPHYNYVGDSVLGCRAHMGAGAVASNLKSVGGSVTVHLGGGIDTGLRKFGAILGDSADVGCGCVLNPGTVVGRRSIIYPLTSVRGVVPEGVIMKGQNNFSKRI